MSITPAGLVNGNGDYSNLRVSRNLRKMLDAQSPQKLQKNLLPFSLKNNKLTEHDVVISPDLARYLLTHSRNNRVISEPRVLAYAKDMEKGHWQYGVDYIRLDVNGDLRQGTHTLLAVVHSGSTIRMKMQVGVPLDMAEKIDQGRPWSYSDIIGTTETTPNPKMMATMARLMSLYDLNEPPFSSSIVSTAQNHETLNKYRREIEEAVTFVNSIPDIYFRRNTLAWLYVIQCRHNPEMVREFISGVASGANLPDGDARLLLFKRLYEGKGRTKTKILRRSAEFILVSDAWSLYYAVNTGLSEGSVDRERLRLPTRAKGGKHLKFRGFYGLPSDAPSRYRRVSKPQYKELITTVTG